MVRKTFVIVVILAAFIQCSSSDATKIKHNKYDPFFIYEDEIRNAYYNNLYDFIIEARPQWLRPKHFHSMKFPKVSFPEVYVNGLRFGTMMSLKHLGVLKVYEVEYIKPIDATTRFGVDNDGGLIVVKMYY